MDKVKEKEKEKMQAAKHGADLKRLPEVMKNPAQPKMRFSDN